MEAFVGQDGRRRYCEPTTGIVQSFGFHDHEISTSKIRATVMCLASQITQDRRPGRVTGAPTAAWYE